MSPAHSSVRPPAHFRLSTVFNSSTSIKAFCVSFSHGPRNRTNIKWNQIKITAKAHDGNKFCVSASFGRPVDIETIKCHTKCKALFHDATGTYDKCAVSNFQCVFPFVLFDYYYYTFYDCVIINFFSSFVHHFVYIVFHVKCSTWNVVSCSKTMSFR